MSYVTDMMRSGGRSGKDIMEFVDKIIPDGLLIKVS